MLKLNFDFFPPCSYTEWEYILNNCSMLFFSAMARFLSHVALDKLVAMNIPGDSLKPEKALSFFFVECISFSLIRIYCYVIPGSTVNVPIPYR